MSHDVADKTVRFRDPRLNRSRENGPQVVGYGIFHAFFVDNFRLKVASDDISGAVVVEYVGVDVSVKFGDI